MKVKELIEKLKELDQEKEIYILYDSFAFLDPEPIEYEPDEEYEEIGNCYVMEAC